MPFKKLDTARKGILRLPPAAFKVWLCHLLHSGKDETSYPSIDLIEAETGLSKNTIVSARAWLVKYHWLVRAGEVPSRDGRFSVPIFRCEHRGSIPDRTQILGSDDADAVPKKRVATVPKFWVASIPKKRVGSRTQNLGTEVDTCFEVATGGVDTDEVKRVSERVSEVLRGACGAATPLSYSLEFLPSVPEHVPAHQSLPPCQPPSGSEAPAPPNGAAPPSRLLSDTSRQFWDDFIRGLFPAHEVTENTFAMCEEITTRLDATGNTNLNPHAIHLFIRTHKKGKLALAATTFSAFYKSVMSLSENGIVAQYLTHDWVGCKVCMNTSEMQLGFTLSEGLALTKEEEALILASETLEVGA